MKPRPHRPQPRQVLIVEDHPLMRASIVNYVGRAPDLTVWGEADSVKAALQLLESSQPDIVVTDLSLAHRNGFGLIEDACARYPTVPFLVHSMHSESFHALKAFRAGASGYVMKGDSEQLLAGIRCVLAGELVFSERAQHDILNHLLTEPRDGSQPPFGLLTDPERELFELCGSRTDPAAMARTLHESPSRVSELLSMIAQKLRIANEVAVFHSAVLWSNAKAEKRKTN
jgi:DNA-binding NarL/FixJ family response regulator